jgi:hypothetical protein
MPASPTLLLGAGATSAPAGAEGRSLPAVTSDVDVSLDSFGFDLHAAGARQSATSSTAAACSLNAAPVVNSAMARASERPVRDAVHRRKTSS